MKRRDFNHRLGLAGLALSGMAGAARAQTAAPVEGKDYARLQTPAPVGTLPNGKKVEVIEFFWYGCSHCFRLEPLIEAWAKRLPPDVHFRQLPFAFIGPVEHQKLFYALEELGQREAMQRKLFNAIHVERKVLNTEAEITKFVAANGIDSAKFTEAFKSFGVNTKLSRGKALSDAYKIDSVPTIGVQGRYFTSASLAGSHERALQIADQLIVRARQPA
ncbi:MAG TPA: thiol:disulfide interchange protein DsbA/DsbL [Rubrivivax sp.]|nr:thiol:disulfide interchange protein DsbA/DsbL [Rubrivivax sp.]